MVVGSEGENRRGSRVEVQYKKLSAIQEGMEKRECGRGRKEFGEGVGKDGWEVSVVE